MVAYEKSGIESQIHALHVRIEAAPIGKKARKGNVSCVEDVAYGTELWLKPP